jgi:hypothetical protein
MSLGGGWLKVSPLLNPSIGILKEKNLGQKMIFFLEIFHDLSKSFFFKLSPPTLLVFLNPYPPPQIFCQAHV